MNVISYSDARASLKAVMDSVCDSHEPAIVTRQKGEAVVVMAKADYDSVMETLYLLSSPANAQRLMESVNRIKAGQAQERELIKDDSE
ncbi:type II toxin-antitoxin system prevent-host-death family antitoxin [Marinobacterium sp. D7]|uniref:type II toxin-antitoxin system Phd/YefM family antitoxin n=1 Tax=Marinobacterium ramblicola TaxID=2849041 RepID=UPI001C2D85AB|nr:type II toxin-antitoxin system prevent-host-death family antitoxin [Marinobacterium ramblicola]MBV1790208.1 type II toxin-antitoxin system prevent-host-death family antitoxin [Marinobacterium ramblicola]